MKDKMELLESLGTELEELSEKMDKLDLFIGSEGYCSLDEAHQELLVKQYAAMRRYKKVLVKRIKLIY